MPTIKEKASLIIDRFTSDPKFKAAIQAELALKRGAPATVKAIIGMLNLDDVTRRRTEESILKGIAGLDSFHIANYHLLDAKQASQASDTMSAHIVAVKAILAS
ncbi:hypothetical protein AAKU55_001026 [Oxalobacteraceae bacterium GrIS 1.11]